MLFSHLAVPWTPKNSTENFLGISHVDARIFQNSGYDLHNIQTPHFKKVRAMDGGMVLLGTTALMAGLGALEARSHRRQLARVPKRIPVNGTRGKSSVTRLIAGGLQAGGLRTCAKTTGTLPRMILPDGSEYPVFRPGKTNVIEQIRIVRTAVAHQAEALVIP